MATVPPIAKVICPTSTGYFPRHRLYRLLDKARKASVLWITGPPGCGKTALVLMPPQGWVGTSEGEIEFTE